MNRRPVLLLDVDGVISLFGFDPLNPPDGRFVLVDGNVHFLSAAAGALVLALHERFELVWCTGWEERADEHLPTALGIPAGLVHLSFGPPDPALTRHWKLPAIERFADGSAGRALAWIDDGFDESCHAWAATRAAPTLLLQTTPHVGLTDEHVRTLFDWAARL